MRAVAAFSLRSVQTATGSRKLNVHRAAGSMARRRPLSSLELRRAVNACLSLAVPARSKAERGP